MKIKMVIFIFISFFQIFIFSFCHSYIYTLTFFIKVFSKTTWYKNYEIFNNFVFSLKVLQPLMATAGCMWALVTSCYICKHFRGWIMAWLTPKAPPIIWSRRQFQILLFFFSKITNKAWYFGRQFSWNNIPDFFPKIKKYVTKFVVCCSRERRFKG